MASTGGYGDRRRGWDGARGWGQGAGNGSIREPTAENEHIMQHEPVYNCCIIVHQHHHHYN